MGTTRKGQCLCKAVTITIPKELQKVGACHCSMCRSWSGGPFMEITCADDVTIEGEDNIEVYDSSEWAGRGFCKTCGSNLFYKLKPTGQHMVSVGLFADTDDLTFDNQVFIDEKPNFYTFKEETDTMTGPELFAKHGG